MNKLRFEFDCQRPVASYQQALNQALKHPLVVGISHDHNQYAVEAQGDKTELGQLADELGAKLPLSCWLKRAQIKAIDTITTQSSPLPQATSEAAFCPDCADAVLADKPWQANCRQCSPKTEVQTQAVITAYGEDLSGLAVPLKQLFAVGHAQFETLWGQVELYLPEQIPSHCQRLLFCRLEAINHAFAVSNQAIERLSSLEKPALIASVNPGFAAHNQLPRSLYQCQFADDLVTLKLSQLLANKGVAFVGVATVSGLEPSLIGSFGEHPIALRHRQASAQISVSTEPLHEHASVKDFQAHWAKGRVSLSHQPAHPSAGPSWHAACALHAAQVIQEDNHRLGALYLSCSGLSGLLYQDSQQNYQWLVQLASPVPTPAQLIQSMQQQGNSAERLVRQLQSKLPEQLARWQVLSHSFNLSSFSAFLASASWCLGFSESADSSIAKDALIARALRYNASNAPRIDYPLSRNHEGVLQINWHKSLQACLSYRLADPDQLDKVAFGIIDSFADFVANWLEQLDADEGVDAIALAGDEFENPVLLDRIRLRVGHNQTLLLPQELGFDGANIALGALYLRRRR
ncbi:hypothetical protein [Paraferrimonas sedimenticola]|uniref:NiFe hydrogenase assembly chaperone HyaE n=1 Tax=Paraferrimonas sedimenticola TaxID=375674 RepID=A0AA37RUK9_9GAMM|nr:hypothetical protein [Paraferrimonas sedimenticola]GLP95611.1 NiFe hydrogenase assembly chaperone HyaE [Paraferrimonas sedimenticola]